MNRNSMGTRTLHMYAKPKRGTRAQWRCYLYGKLSARTKKEAAALRRREVFDARQHSGNAPAWNTYTALRATDTMADSIRRNEL